MHISLVFKNLSPDFQTDWDKLRVIVTAIKSIYPKINVDVHVSYEYETSFQVDPYLEAIAPYSRVEVGIQPMTDIQKSDISKFYTQIIRGLVAEIMYFIAASDPRNDPSVQPQYFPSTRISISAGFGESIFIDGKPE